MAENGKSGITSVPASPRLILLFFIYYIFTLVIFRVKMLIFHDTVNKVTYDETANYMG